MAIELLQAMAQHANYLKMVNRCFSDGVDHCRCTSHHDCKFGKWFYADGTAQFGTHGNPEIVRLWNDIEIHHMRFHEHSLQAVAYLRQDNGKEQFADLFAESETKMMQCSTVLVNKLLELDQHLHCFEIPQSFLSIAPDLRL